MNIEITDTNIYEIFFKLYSKLKLKLHQKEPKTRKQKNRGAGVEHRGVCVECSKQIQNSQTNPKLGNKNRGR